MIVNKPKKPLLIAEISSNHNGKIENAIKLIYLAKKYGADAVKLQTFTPETMTLNSKKNTLKLAVVYGKVILYGIYIQKLRLLYLGTTNFFLLQRKSILKYLAHLLMKVLLIF